MVCSICINPSLKLPTALSNNLWNSTGIQLEFNCFSLVSRKVSLQTPTASWCPDYTPKTCHPHPGMCNKLSAHALLRGRRSSLTCQNGKPLIWAVSTGFWWNRASWAHRCSLVFPLEKVREGTLKQAWLLTTGLIVGSLTAPWLPQDSRSSGVVVCPIPNHCSLNGGGLTDHGNASGTKVFLPLQLFLLSWRNGLCTIVQTSLHGLKPVSILKLSSKTESMRTFLFL